MRTRCILTFICSLIGGCGSPSDDPVLARVGQTDITASQLRDFESRLSEQRKTTKAGVEGYLDYLQTLTDKEILVQEARKQGLADRAEFRRKLKSERDMRLEKSFLRKQVYAKIDLAHEELRRHQIETSRDYAVKMQRIVVPSLEEAEEVARALKAGADFGELASRSIVDSTALMQSRFLLLDEIDPPILQEKVFPLEKLEVSEPIFYAEQYGVYQIIDKRAVEVEEVRNLLEPELFAKKIPSMIEDVTAKLRQEIDFQINQQALDQIAALFEQGIDNISSQDLETVLIQFKDGRFTLHDYVELVRMHNIGFGDDVHDRVHWFNKQVLIPHVLIIEGARAIGMDQEPDFVEWFQRREQAMLLQAMRNESIADIFVEESEARRYYKEHPDKFKPLESITVQEILVQTEGEAAFLLDQISQGEDLAALAQEHTLRSRSKANKGEFHIHPYETKNFGELIEAARGAGVDQLVGPVEVTVKTSELLSGTGMSGGRYYSIFKVIESTIGAGPEPFSKVERRARALIHRDKNNIAFYQFLLKLRYEYEGEIEIYHDNVEKLASAPKS